MNITETQTFYIRYWNDPILTTVCEPVRDSEFGASLELFAQRMTDAMNAYKGVGLAAPQIGLPVRMFVMNAGNKSMAVCNPTIELKGDKVYAREGCLSVPEIFESVNRSGNTVMRYFTPLGIEQEVEFDGLSARIAQHEEDHLNGIMFFDRQRVGRQINRAVERQWLKKKKFYVKK